MFTLIHHTADVRARVTAPSLESLFTDAVHALYAVMHGEAHGEPVTRTIAVDDSADTTALLVDFLNEVLGRAQIGRELFDRVAFTRFDETSLTAELHGRAPAEFEEDVKAVTYHEAEVVRDGEAWTTMLVFDL
ncbi:MAG TPA: archease [Thermoanaerobaculia bacterium]|nr:archease [Thermoanaerobaculia bacterium]